MRLNIKIVVLSACLYATSLLQGYAQQICRAYGLRTEYLNNPIGLDAATPRLSWKMSDPAQGALQSAYKILVGTDSANLENRQVWNTGWVKSSNNLVTYNGKPLQPFTRYYWTVALADGKQRQGPPAATGSFETGMMTARNWKGSWIADQNDIHVRPAPYFRKTFVTSRKLKCARAYIAAAGLYELSVNGKKVGDHRLDPMYTRFDRRTLYVTYDVTSRIQEGKNAIGVLLGNGWYNLQSTAVWDFHKANWRARPAFCLDLRLTYDDGSTEIISSGKDWKTSLSPVIFNSIYTAEHYDARLEQRNWDQPEFDDSKWKPVIYRSAPSSNIVAQAMHPVKNVEEIPAVSCVKFNDTTYLFNLGRNISGVSRITIDGPEGTIVRLKHGERLYKNGHVDLSNIDAHYRPTDNTDPFQTDRLILSGKGPESFMPHFNYKGFQYVEVTSSRPVRLRKENLKGYFMHSDVPAIGSVASANPVIDKILSATNNSYLSNLFGYPTDCPQREKNGWTGDAQIAIETGLYSFDGITVYEKWMADHRDEQQPNGILPSIIPTNGWGYEWGNGPDWTSTIAIIPWNLYLFYGDSKALADCYLNIRRYVDHIDETYPSGLTSWGLGDWVPVKSTSPVELTSTCYYYADAVILAKTAKILGKDSDYQKYTALSQKIKTAFNEKFLDETTGIYGKGVQTELSVPLFWGLVPEALKSKVADQLAKRVAADGYHLDVGLLGQKAILNALTENGYADIAYTVAAQQTYPSWGWWIANGATTLYENWNIAAASDISLNHIMFGEIGAWIYKGLGGIRPDADNPGFKNVLLQPHFVNGLDHFEARHQSPYGEIISSWKRKGTGIRYKVTIPPNSTATVSLPQLAGQKISMDGTQVTDSSLNLPAGTYVFSYVKSGGNDRQKPDVK